MTKTSTQTGTAIPRVPEAHNELNAKEKKQRAEWPAEGPHARNELVNEAATPGSGLFSDNSFEKSKVDPGAG